MAKEIKKAVLSLKSKVTLQDTEDSAERRIRFVASSVNTDRHYEQVATDSLRLPLKNGGEIKASAIPAEGLHDLVDIPLMLNHSADVRDVIGSVRSVFFENGELIFEAGISKREIAQDMLVLLEEGHLSNAFSITMADYDYNFDTETISNAEIIEVSLVYRGSNKEARLLAIKSLNERKEKAMPEIKKASSTDSAFEKDEIREAEVTQDSEDAEQTVEKVETVENNKEEGEEMNKPKAIALDQVKEVSKASPRQSYTATTGDYLKSKGAMADFARILEKNAGQEPDDVKKAWKDHLATKGITNADMLMPQAMIDTITDSVEQNGTIFNLIDKTGLTVLRLGRNTIGLEDEKGRAKGHKKGADKKELEITLADRVLRAQYIYDYLTLNKEDIRENRDTGALVKYVLETLPKRIIAEIERAIVLGDGRNADGDEITSFISIKKDVETADSPFATKYETPKDEPLYKSLVKASSMISAPGKAYLITSKATIAELKLSESKSGNLIFPIGSDFAGAFDLSGVFTPEWFNDTEYQAFIVVLGQYKSVGDSSIESFTNFALKQNKQEYLQEIYIGGGLGTAKSAVGITVPKA